MILILDNYDSFVYNLYQMVGTLYPDLQVVRNDRITVEEIAALKPEGIILSPGPGRPEDAGIMLDLLRSTVCVSPVLGVCLGHQAICMAFGGTIGHAQTLFHGKQSLAKIENSSPLFRDLPSEITVARYHSLALEEATLPATLAVTARTDDEIMAVEHRERPIYGVQFHPESIMTPDGQAILANFIKITQRTKL